MTPSTRYFWLRSGKGLAAIIALLTLPTFLIFSELGAANEVMALATGVAICLGRHLAWLRWGRGS